MIDLIYIGDYKTGTSWWQSRVLLHHPGICYLDDPVSHPEVVRLMHELVDTRDLDFDADLLREKFQEVLKGIDCKGRKKVICREALSGKYPTGENAKRTAERMRDVFGDTKILIVIREQFSMLKSIYSQYIKIGGTLCFKDFVYSPAVSAGLLEKVKYHKLIDFYWENFGEKNVYIGIFEKFKENNEQFVNDVLKFSGCSTSWLPSGETIAVNPSLRVAGLELQRFLNHFLHNDMNPSGAIVPISIIFSFFISSKKKLEILKKIRNRLVYSSLGRDDATLLKYAINFSLTVRISKLCEYIQFGPKLHFPDDLRLELMNEFVETNKILRDKYNIPVDVYGWSL